jgi:hypothetical protein
MCLQGTSYVNLLQEHVFRRLSLNALALYKHFDLSVILLSGGTKWCLILEVRVNHTTLQDIYN